MIKKHRCVSVLCMAAMPVWPALKWTISQKGAKIVTSTILFKGRRGLQCLSYTPDHTFSRKLVTESWPPCLPPSKDSWRNGMCILRQHLVCLAELGQHLIVAGWQGVKISKFRLSCHVRPVGREDRFYFNWRSSQHQSSWINTMMGSYCYRLLTNT